MEELSEEDIAARWMTFAEQEPDAWKTAIETFRTQQPSLWERWSQHPPEVQALGIQLACASTHALSRTSKKLPSIQSEKALKSANRFQSLTGFLQRRLREAEPLEATFNQVGEKFPIRQWALVGLIAETILDEIEHGSLPLEHAPALFSELVLQIDAIDRTLSGPGRNAAH